MRLQSRKQLTAQGVFIKTTHIGSFENINCRFNIDCL